MTDNPDQTSQQQQAERLIIENQNEDGSFDMKGIANDIAALLKDVKPNTSDLTGQKQTLSTTSPQSPDSGAIDQQSINGGAVQGGGELREFEDALMHYDLENISVGIKLDGGSITVYEAESLYTDLRSDLFEAVEQLITTPLRAQLEELREKMPEIQHWEVLSYSEQQERGKGFNEAVAKVLAAIDAELDRLKETKA